MNCKKRTILTLLFSALACSFATAQSNNFAPIGTTWHYNFHPNMCNPFIFDYFSIESVADSLLQGKNCRVLRYQSSDQSIEKEEFIYEDAGIVYFHFDTAFYALYNFNVIAGDSVYFGLKSRTSNNQEDSILMRTGVVDSIYTDSSGSRPIHNYRVSMQPLGQAYHYSEAIGRQDELITSYWEYSFVGCPPYLRCYADSSLYYRGVDYPDSLACDFKTPTAVTAINVKNPIQIYPNPFQSQVTIDLKTESYANLSLGLWDVLGRELFSTTLHESSGTFQVAIPDYLPKGAYLLVLKSESRTKLVLNCFKN